MIPLVQGHSGHYFYFLDLWVREMKKEGRHLRRVSINGVRGGGRGAITESILTSKGEQDHPRYVETFEMNQNAFSFTFVNSWNM